MENHCAGCLDYHFENGTSFAWCSHSDCVEENIDNCALYHRATSKEPVKIKHNGWMNTLIAHGFHRG